jgi:hypothetical protein
MSGDDAGPGADPAPRRTDSWSLRKIVEDVSGRTIEEFQDPDRAPHPYLRVKPPPGAPAPGAATGDVDPDPVARVFPPLVGATGRSLHPPELHHVRVPVPAEPEEGLSAPHAPGLRRESPSRKPERVYLHYLLLHLDRLSDHSLTYLKHAVDEERAHREGSPPS